MSRQKGVCVALPQSCTNRIIPRQRPCSNFDRRPKRFLDQNLILLQIAHQTSKMKVPFSVARHEPLVQNLSGLGMQRLKLHTKTRCRQRVHVHTATLGTDSPLVVLMTITQPQKKLRCSRRGHRGKLCSSWQETQSLQHIAVILLPSARWFQYAGTSQDGSTCSASCPTV